MGTSTGDFIDALYLEREYGIRSTVSTILMIIKRVPERYHGYYNNHIWLLYHGYEANSFSQLVSLRLWKRGSGCLATVGERPLTNYLANEETHFL